MPLLGFKTIHDGERALVKSYTGEAKVVEGPARITLFRSNVEKLRRYFAEEGEYLEVNQHSGPRLCLPGPATLFLNPIQHENIKVREAIFVNSSEALIVYRIKPSADGITTLGKDGEKIREEAKQNVERKVIKGPTRYIPEPNEWIHEFKWHGSDPKDKTRKEYGALQFTLLRTIADQLYYNVREVRTKDDTMLTVKLMIFFELVDVETMLDSTHDPIADIINAAASDTVAFCAVLTYEEFLERTSEMNQMTTFKQLDTRAVNIGYKVTKVVFRGFHSSDALQAMHDKAIQERTKLRLETDTEDQRQRHLDMQLAKEGERAEKERELERNKEQHRRELEEAEHKQELGQGRRTEEAKLETEKAVHKQQLEQRRETEQADLERRRNVLEVEKLNNMEEMNKLNKMKEMEVDLTAVLVAECHNPDKTYRIEAGGKEGKVKLHLHDN